MTRMSRAPVYVHVGLPKTGTTQLQRIMWDNREVLAAQGVHYPGARRAAHFDAALDLLGSRRRRAPDAWPELLELIGSAPGSVVFSHEMLAALPQEKVGEVAAALAPREVHVLVSVRDFSRIVPATWQERAKNREVEPWPQFLEQVSAGPAAGHPFWRLQDAPRVIRDWADHVPGDRIHVLTVPQLSQDPRLLLRRFASVVGFDADGVTVPPKPANQSVGAAEIALLQRVNALTRDLDWEGYRRLVKNHLVRDVLGARPEQVRVVLPEDARPWVESETRRIAETLREVGCDVVGDLADLEPTGIGASGPRTTSAPHEVEDAAVLATAADTVVQLLRESDEHRRRPVPARPAPSVHERARALVRRVRQATARRGR